MDVSDRVEKEKADSPLVLALEDNAQHVVGVDWRQNIGVSHAVRGTGQTAD